MEKSRVHKKADNMKNNIISGTEHIVKLISKLICRIISKLILIFEVEAFLSILIMIVHKILSAAEITGLELQI